MASNDTNADTTGDVVAAGCFHIYKPSSGDNSASYFWRVVYVTGSAHGGNFNHKMTLAEGYADLGGSNNNIVDWAPTQTQPYSSCTNRSITFGLSGNGWSGSISDQFAVCPDSYGPQQVDLNNDIFQWGWKGDKGCGSGTCSFVGISGGYEDQVQQGTTFNYLNDICITWHDYLGNAYAKCAKAT